MRDSSKKIIGGVALLLIYLSFTDSAFCEQTGEFKDCDHKSVPDNAENDRIWKTKKDLIIRSQLQSDTFSSESASPEKNSSLREKFENLSTKEKQIVIQSLVLTACLIGVIIVQNSENLKLQPLLEEISKLLQKRDKRKDRRNHQIYNNVSKECHPGNNIQRCGRQKLEKTQKLELWFQFLKLKKEIRQRTVKNLLPEYVARIKTKKKGL